VAQKSYPTLFPQEGQNFDWGGISFLQDEHSEPRIVGEPQFGQKLYDDDIFSEDFGQDRKVSIRS
jgi:hypothetical protein